jgi:carbonic anhydrase/acetyltransferase-like protein (isoleucine patch superfamily)
MERSEDVEVSPSLAACGPGTTIHPSAVIVEPASVRLGSGVTVEPLAVLMGSPDSVLEVGDRSLIAPHAYLQGLGGRPGSRSPRRRCATAPS